MFRGEGVWGARRGGVWSPIGGLEAVPPEICFKIKQQILAKYSTFLPNTSVEKEFFTVVKRQDNN